SAARTRNSPHEAPAPAGGARRGGAPPAGPAAGPRHRRRPAPPRRRQGAAPAPARRAEGVMSTVVVDQSGWGKLRVTGEDRERFLQGMVTNDLAGMAVGSFRRAAILSVKGRVLAVVDIVAEEGSYLVLTEPVTARKVAE